MKMDANILIRDVTDALQREGISFEVMSKGSREEAAAVEWLEGTFPVESWGRVGWNRVENADCRQWATWDDMIRTYGDLLDRMQQDLGQPDAPVLLIWSNAARPILRVPFAALRVCGAEILDEDSDVWILCPSQGWCIEKYHEGELCYGRIG
jgi:hypothetical protein